MGDVHALIGAQAVCRCMSSRANFNSLNRLQTMNEKAATVFPDLSGELSQ